MNSPLRVPFCIVPLFAYSHQVVWGVVISLLYGPFCYHLLNFQANPNQCRLHVWPLPCVCSRHSSGSPTHRENELSLSADTARIFDVLVMFTTVIAVSKVIASHLALDLTPQMSYELNSDVDGALERLSKANQIKDQLLANMNKGTSSNCPLLTGSTYCLAQPCWFLPFQRGKRKRINRWNPSNKEECKVGTKLCTLVNFLAILLSL